MARFLRALLIPLFVLFTAAGAWVLPKFEAKAALSALSDALDTASRLVSRNEDTRLEPNELIDVLAVIASGTRNNESNAFVHSKAAIIAEGNTTVPLVARQDEDGGLNENSCRTICCGGSLCGNSAAKKRSLKDSFDLPWLATTEDNELRNASRGLHKRAFPTLDTSDPAAIGPYLRVREDLEPHYELLEDIDGGDISFTLTLRFRDFRSFPLVIMSPELTGCTVLTVVSRTAVYMGHFWQKLAFDQGEWGRPNLQRNALNLISGQGPLYLAGGTSLDPDLFRTETITTDNGETVTVRPYAAIMTPRYGVGQQQLYYPARINRIAALVRRIIDVDPVIYGYQSDDEGYGNQGPDGRLGAALFEYEWDADGEGNGDWRLWFEYSHESGRGLGMFPQGKNMPQ